MQKSVQEWRNKTSALSGAGVGSDAQLAGWGSCPGVHLQGQGDRGCGDRVSPGGTEGPQVGKDKVYRCRGAAGEEDGEPGQAFNQQLSEGDKTGRVQTRRTEVSTSVPPETQNRFLFTVQHSTVGREEGKRVPSICSFPVYQISRIYQLPKKGEHTVFVFSSLIQAYPTLCDAMDYSTPDFSVHHQLLELTQTHGHWVGDAIQPSHPLSSSPPPAFNLSQHQGLFQWVRSLHQVVKVFGSFSFSISPSSEYSGLISFRKDWLDLLAVQGTLKSLLQHHSSKASILQHSAFFMIQLSHPYTPVRKIIALIRWTWIWAITGDKEGQRSLASCSPWRCKEWDMT